jgi:hypothetical protein
MSDELGVRVDADGAASHTDCGQEVAVDGDVWRCHDCDDFGPMPEVYPGGWTFYEGVWRKAVGDGSIDCEVFGDEMEDWPPLVELRAQFADAVVIRREDIPDGLVRRVKRERHGSRALTVDDLVWLYAALNGRADEAAARLLSGGGS